MNLSERIAGSKYFTWKEALWLPRWNRAATTEDGLTDEIVASLIHTFQWMDKVRIFLGKPINVHVAFRPVKYNAEVGGAPNGMHPKGKAVDFSVAGYSCDEVKDKLKAKLVEWNLRMEDNGQGAGWVHLDDREPGPAGRFFKP